MLQSLTYLLHMLFVGEEKESYFHFTPVTPAMIALTATIFYSMCQVIGFFKYYLLTSPTTLSIIIFVILMIVLILCMFTLLDITRYAMYTDLWKYFEFECYDRNPNGFNNKYSTEYKYLGECVAYFKHKHYGSKTDCAISCGLNDNYLTKTLLGCGHLFHSQCIGNAERSYFLVNKSEAHICAPCPFCKSYYHTEFEKFNYNPNWHYGNILYYWLYLKPAELSGINQLCTYFQKKVVSSRHRYTIRM